MATSQKSDKKFNFILILLVLISAILTYNRYHIKENIINTKMLNKLVESRDIKSLSIDDEYLTITTKDSHYLIYKGAVDIPALASKYPIEVSYDSELIEEIILTILIFVAFLYLLKLNHKNRVEQLKYSMSEYDELKSEITPISSNVSFSDVAGIDIVKEDLEEIIDFLQSPKKYMDMGIRMPKGVLLVGPPGVGKTLVAKAVAGEANVPFFYQSGASFVQIYVGMGAKRVSELFTQAKKNAPSIVFIDEIDAVGKSRDGFRNDEREATLNELLTQMDGFEANSGVIVIGATNKIDILDDALLRAGRFDRRIHLSLPNFEDRKEILSLYLSDKKVKGVDVEKLARECVGFSAASLDTLVNEATLNALKNGQYFLEESNFEAVKEKVMRGKREVLSFTDREKEIQSLYQASKVVIATWLDLEFDKMTLLSSSITIQDREILSKGLLINRVKFYLSGAVYTHSYYGEFFSNSKDDIKSAKEIVYQIVEEFSMVDRFRAKVDTQDELFDTIYSEVQELVSQLKEPILVVSKELLSVESISKVRAKEIIDEIF